MRQETTPKEKAAIISSILAAVGDTIKEAGAVPSGHLYSVLSQFGCTMQQYERMINIFKESGKVQERNNLLYWID